jgi:hypothetical protein
MYQRLKFRRARRRVAGGPFKPFFVSSPTTWFTKCRSFELSASSLASPRQVGEERRNFEWPLLAGQRQSYRRGGLAHAFPTKRECPVLLAFFVLCERAGLLEAFPSARPVDSAFHAGDSRSGRGTIIVPGPQGEAVALGMGKGAVDPSSQWHRRFWGKFHHIGYR